VAGNSRKALPGNQALYLVADRHNRAGHTRAPSLVQRKGSHRVERASWAAVCYPKQVRQ
jgi:hypothetical protein